MKKITSIILMVVLLFPLFITNTTSYGFTGLEVRDTYEPNRITIDAIKDMLPENQLKNVKGFELNATLFIDKGILVYGSYASIPSNDFGSHIDPSQQGYYIRNGQRGEYRYHGFDYQGNPYANNDFRRDADSGRSGAEKNWLYRPFEKYGSRNELVDRSDYSLWATQGHFSDPSIQIKTQQWINRMIDFNINSQDHSSKNPYDYIHVQSPSGIRTVGEGRMWHVDANGKRWYQTFSIPRQQHIDKVLLPTVAEIAVLNKPAELVFKKDQDSLTLRVKVEGIYQDDGKNHTEELRTAYYTGYDIDHWEISLQATATAKQTVQVNKEALSKGSAIFEVVVQRNQVLSNPVIELMGGAKAIFGNQESAGLAEKLQTITVEAEGKSLMSYFTVSSHIALNNGSNLNKNRINFKDASIGKTVRYEYHVELVGANSISFSYNTNKVDDADVDQKIYDFIAPKIAGKTEGEYTVKITQIVRSADGDMDACEQTMIILIKPVELGPITTIAPKMDADMPQEWFDIVPYPAQDKTEGATARRVSIDGVAVNADVFFNGQYVFGASDVDRLVQIRIEYDIVDLGAILGGAEPEFSMVRWVYVYSTKPRAQFDIEGSYKQNRKMTLTDTSGSANAEFVLQHYPLINYDWSIQGNGGDITSLRTRNISDVYRELMFKEPGGYTIELTVSNGLGRVSDIHSVDIYIHEDYTAAVIFNLWNNSLARGEEMSLYHDVVSIDGDTISKNIMEIYHDSNNDGEATELLGTYTAEEFEGFIPVALGTYKVVNIVEEDFGEDTLEEFITEEDRTRVVVEREFFVDNYRPLTELYIDIPMKLPEIDVFFMMDQNITREKNNYVVSNRMNINNALRLKNIRPKVEVWDLHTYVYSQPASTVRYTGGSYPPTTTFYTSGDYSGTLNRVSVTNNPYSVDQGWWTTVSETTTTTVRHWTTTTSSGGGTVYPGPPWNYGDAWVVNGVNHVSWYYDEVVTTTTYRDVWVSNWVSYDDYTGHYTGTIYKYVKQPYTNPFRTLSDKYIIYISDGNIANMADLQSTLSRAAANVILMGPESMKSQIPHVHFILNNKPMEELVGAVINYIAETNPYVAKYLVLAGEETFNISHANYDDEGDPIIHEGFQYVQDQSYYDNPIGMEGYAREAFSEEDWIPTKPNRFDTTGKFEIFRRIIDKPTEDPNFADFSYISNTPMLEVYSHRRPIAYATLDWDFDAVKGLYKTTWVDGSYDLDHMHSRADRGIIERKIRYRRNSGEWIYRIPDELQAGSYNIEYYVKDPENTWSNVFTLNFTLNDIPPVQLEAKARPLLPQKFAINSIPASEQLELYDVWTRYPYTVRLEVAMFQGSTQRTTTQTINYSSATGTKVGNDIYWNNIVHTIPATLPDGSYTLRITAVGQSGQTTQRNFPVTVRTPINLVPDINPQWITTDYTDIRANTTKYANTVTAQLHRGQPFSTTVGLSGIQSGDLKNWLYSYLVSGSIPDGDYTARFTATTPNGNTEYVDVNYRVDSLKITGHLLPNPAMAGDQILFYIQTEGYADRLEIVVPDDMIAMDQRVAMGYNPVSYPSIFFPVNGVVMAKEDILKYTVWVTTEQTLGEGSTRLRTPYRFIVRAWKGTVSREIELELDIKGDIRSLIRPGIKNKN